MSSSRIEVGVVNKGQDKGQQMDIDRAKVGGVNNRVDTGQQNGH